jgi:hypothetical protein
MVAALIVKPFHSALCLNIKRKACVYRSFFTDLCKSNKVNLQCPSTYKHYYNHQHFFREVTWKKKMPAATYFSWLHFEKKFQ